MSCASWSVAVLRVLLLLCALFGPTWADPSKSGLDTVQRVAAEQDDFTLTAEQERLLFDDIPTAPFTAHSYPAPTPAAADTAEATNAAATATASTEENHTASHSHESHFAVTAARAPSPRALSAPPPAAASDSASRPVSAAVSSSASQSASVASCPDDFGGVVRLLSALFSPSAIRHPGRWSVHTEVSQLDYDTMSRLLRTHKPQDALDRIALGEQLLASANYQSADIGDAHNAARRSQAVEAEQWPGEGPLTVALVWLQGWAARLERLLHHKLVAPLHLPSTASVLLLGVVVLLLPATVIVALKLAAPVVVSVLTPSMQRRRLSQAAEAARAAPSQAASSAAAAINGAEQPSLSHLFASTALTQTSASSARVGRSAAGSRNLRTSPSESLGNALWFGSLLLLVTLFTAGLVHHWHTLHVEQLARNRILQSNPPPGCYQSDEPASLTSLFTSLTTYLTRSKRDDACWRYEASLLQSSWPNPGLVLSSYLSTVLFHPLPHLGDAVGGFMDRFLSHFSVVMQGAMLASLLVLSIAVVALCMVSGKACLLRWCTGWGRSARGSRLWHGRGPTGGRRLRDNSVRIEELIDEQDDEQDDEQWAEEEDERDRRRLLRRLLSEHRRREEDKQIRAEMLLLKSGQQERRRREDVEAEEGVEEVKEDRERVMHEAGEQVDSIDGREEQQQQRNLTKPRMHAAGDSRAEVSSQHSSDSRAHTSTRSHTPTPTPTPTPTTTTSSSGAPHMASADDTLSVHHKRSQQQHRQQHAVKTEPAEQQQQQQQQWRGGEAVPGTPSPGPATSASSPTSSQPYSYPVARSSSAQQRQPQPGQDEAKVKGEEERLDWSSNPLTARLD